MWCDGHRSGLRTGTGDEGGSEVEPKALTEEGSCQQLIQKLSLHEEHSVSLPPAFKEAQDLIHRIWTEGEPQAAQVKLARSRIKLRGECDIPKIKWILIYM